MGLLLNMVRQTVSAIASSGVGALTLSTAAAGYDTFAGAGAVNGYVYSYAIQEGIKWEIGRGTYSTTGPSLARTQIIKSSAGVATAETFTTNAVVICTELAQDLAGRVALWVPAGAMTPRITNGPSLGKTETVTNKVMVVSYDFDPTTPEYLQFSLRMPPSWNRGDVTFVPIWSHAATTTNFKVSWGLQALADSDGDAWDSAFGTAIYSNDTGGTTDVVLFGPESGLVTASGSPIAEDLITFQFLRKADDATNDTLAIDARFHGLTLYLTTEGTTDG